MKLQVIATGSKGNAYLLSAPSGAALLLDAGVRFDRMVRILPDWGKLEAVLVTHEHKDHAAGAEGFAYRGKAVYASAGTIGKIGIPGIAYLECEAGKAFETHGFTVLPFPTEHDAEEPLGFLIRCRETGEVILYATDTYFLRNTFPGVNYWIVECSYMDALLERQVEDGEIPVALRNRLKRSHMSLERLVEALKANDLSHTRAVVLVHMSDTRSDERAMVEAVREATGIENVVAADAGMEIPLELTPF